ncbi:MAG: 1-pyrroline-5-carboxylate dehydrogenase [Flavobacteriaceae bacterium]|nr:1-pyrroline-5-carboxylate dehydrogenase [Flavobacteriaceae bacterium]
MSNSSFKVPYPVNEEILNYTPKSSEKKSVLKKYKELFNSSLEIPLWINGEQIKTGETENIMPPHDHNHSIGFYHKANEKHVRDAIEAALNAKQKWSSMSWASRASIFIKAAELISGPYRDEINASTMLCQSKTIHQAEIDAACELIDFLRYNVYYMQEIYEKQPESDNKVWNRLTYRPLEGFVYAISPFNFTAIAGNLCASAAMMGNVVVWKPSDYQIYSAKVIIKVFEEAGLPKGVINAVFGDPEMISNEVLKSKYFSGLHFTGSTDVFKKLWKKIGDNIEKYNSYPRIVGETGGKDFILAHPSANIKALSTAIIRGAFEFQGQKCSAASRVYLPKSIAKKTLETVGSEMDMLKIGSPENFENFITALIHRDAFNRLKEAIEKIKKDKDADIIYGGEYDDSKGYFIHPTLVKTTNPNFFSMQKELFGPLVTVYVFDDSKWIETLDLVDKTSSYALTGAVFSQDRYAIDEALKALENSAGNFYINDKPTGAVVGKQPFGGSRASGTNDKAGSIYNLLRWVSPRLIKEVFVPPESYKYPFLG